ncbi:MAG: zinc-regulated TonB-dependent outer membrane receptor, partial [Verrucomicrobia bacterium]
GWVAGIRGDYLHMQDSRFTDDPDRQSRSRISANLSWYPTEFSKLRLQYNHDFLESNFFLSGREVDSVFLQFEFILGAHGAHKF